jgi:hypothetical protein
VIYGVSGDYGNYEHDHYVRLHRRHRTLYYSDGTQAPDCTCQDY